MTFTPGVDVRVGATRDACRMQTTLKYKLIGLLTMVALFALPVAEAFANRSWM